MNKRRFNRCRKIAMNLSQVTGHTKDRKARLSETIDSLFCWIETDLNIKGIKSWEDIADYVNEYLYEDDYLFWDSKHGEDKNKFGKQIISCMRASVDLVTGNLGFVAGYTKGDLYKVFNKNLPNWCKRLFKQSFFKLDDSEYIWL